ncbi:MAG: TonB-dependent receptor plug domain-containing protein [Bacteroidota bacterium]
MFARKIISVLFYLTPLLLTAQNDTTSVLLKSVIISAVRSDIHPPGLKTEKPDSLMKMFCIDQTLGNYFTDNTPSLVKNYGPGALSSVSLRGGSAYQTAVLWKGFSISNPMNGVMDFNLLPTFLFDDILIQYGGSSSLWGSGAISGTIQLSNNSSIVNRNSIKAGSRFSSASGWANYAEGKFSFRKFNSSIKLFITDEKNAFSFHQNGELKKQVHADAIGRGIVAENNFLFNSRTTLSFNFWYQFADRNIAPVLTEAISNAVQTDKNYRYNITFTRSFNNGKFVFRNAYFNERLFYNDSSLKEPSISNCKTLISEPEYSISFHKFHTFQAGLNLTAINATATEFNQEAEVIRKAAYLAYNLKVKKLGFSVSARKEINEFQQPPVVFSTGIKYLFSDWLKFFGSFSTVYRNPTVNDLFWQPGGNTELLPETGISYESTLELDLFQLTGKNSNDSNAFSFLITGYKKEIDNWISWTPHGTVWIPSNIKNVHSYGAENSIVFKKKFRHVLFHLSTFYGYTISETTASGYAFDASVGKQLIYVPMYKAGGSLSLTYKNSALSFNQTYTGIRFTTTDNSSFLDDYTKVSTQFDQRFEIQNSVLALFIRVDNLFNKDYQSVLNRPEPLRNFSFGINITYTQKK